MQCPKLKDEDFKAALQDMQTYVDITIEDLRAICSSAIRHAQERISTSMPVSEVMTKKVVAVKKGADLHEVSRLLSENRVSGLPVIDDEARVVGVITEADVLVMTGLQRGHTIKELIKHLFGEPLPKHKEGGRVEAFMTAPAITVKPDADIRETAAILDKKRIKRLPVVDDDNRLVGIISRADIVRAMSLK